MIFIAYFIVCALGGVAACGPTHTALTPLDLIKCRRQVDHQLKGSLISALRAIHRDEGLTGLFCGWLPTCIGYSLLGAFKFGLYDGLKYFCISQEIWSLAMAIPASACAEIIADVALCPWEAIKVTMQTSTSYKARYMRETAKRMATNEGYRSFFQGLYPLWGRQVPYTIVKFFMFEETVTFLYNILGASKDTYSGFQQVMISLIAGYITGIGCAIVSNPADVLVSALNADRRVGETLFNATRRVSRQIGFEGLWKGFSIRVLMIGTLTALQWFTYDVWKVFVGISTTGGD